MFGTLGRAEHGSLFGQGVGYSSERFSSSEPWSFKLSSDFESAQSLAPSSSDVTILGTNLIRIFSLVSLTVQSWVRSLTRTIK